MSSIKNDPQEVYRMISISEIILILLPSGLRCLSFSCYSGLNTQLPRERVFVVKSGVSIANFPKFSVFFLFCYIYLSSMFCFCVSFPPLMSSFFILQKLTIAAIQDVCYLSIYILKSPNRLTILPTLVTHTLTHM